jgi:hypothetical protein
VARVYDAIRVFRLEHKSCGQLRGDAEPLTLEGYWIWAACSCGKRLDRWVTEDDAEFDLLRLGLLAFEN